jgi:putative FmdB family regulatory protein
MPTYDYECDSCGHKAEVFQAMSAEPLKKCPECKKPKYRRLFGAGAALVFKGSGFYQTDYRSEGYKKSAAADKPAESSSGESKSESKSDTKSESKPAKTESKAESKPKKDG